MATVNSTSSSSGDWFYLDQNGVYHQNPNYPGQIYPTHFPQTVSTASTGSPVLLTDYVDELKKRIEILEQELAKRAHIEVAKDQEERLVKLEELISQLLEEEKKKKEEEKNNLAGLERMREEAQQRAKENWAKRLIQNSL